MTNETIQRRSGARLGEFFTVKYFLIRALALVVSFTLVHLAGLRNYTIFLSGTLLNPQVGYQLSAFYGTVYIFLYLGAVVIAPIFVLAAGLLILWKKFVKT